MRTSATSTSSTSYLVGKRAYAITILDNYSRAVLASSVSSTQDLGRAFFSEHFLRVLDALGYVVWRRWRVYGEEGLAVKEAALWLRDKTLTIERGREPLSRYEVEFTAGTEKLTP